jgi:hypothetical protein
MMPDSSAPLTIDFLTWLATGPRPYSEVMESWRTSCPRLTIWEDALDAGLVARRHVPGERAMVALTAKGARMLAAHRGGRTSEPHAPPDKPA